VIAAAVRGFVALKRASGCLYCGPLGLLLSFAKFAEARGDTHVRASTAVAWAASAPSPGQRGRRLRTVARFARFAAIEDPAHEIPPDGAFGRAPPRHLPHIFTQEEIARVVAATAALRPSRGQLPITYSMLFALLAATGLRISEALALRVDDVTPEGLMIRMTKFRKSRLVPLHATTLQAIAQYLEAQRCEGADPHLFVSRRGTRLPYSTVNAVFLRVVRALRLHAGPGHRGPRIHDLRHTFAVRSLEQCAARRDSVGRHMLALSTYLGHSKVAHTYWYLQATPALMNRVAEACEVLFAGGTP
jgi:integrase